MIEQQPDPIVPTADKYQQFTADEVGIRPPMVGLPPKRDWPYFIATVAVVLLAAIYSHEKSSEARAARAAFEQQRDQNKQDKDAAWLQGSMAGANIALNTVGLAMQKSAALSTNLLSFVQSNITWEINLARPK